jgi:hypothetical protein
MDQSYNWQPTILWFQRSLQPGAVAHACNPNYSRGGDQGMKFEASPGKKLGRLS